MRIGARLLVVLSLVVPGVVVAGPVSASTISVNTTADEFGTGAACALREAIRAAELNAAFGGCPAGTPGLDEITVPAGTYYLGAEMDTIDEASGDLDVTSQVTIRGAGADQTIVDAVAPDRVMRIADTTATIQGLTLRNGLAEFAGGLDIHQSTVTLNQVSIRDNEAGMNNGGGIHAFGGQVTLVDSTVAGNTASTYGGGIVAWDTVLTLDRVTVNGNEVLGSGSSAGGGGIYVDGGQVTATNSTITGNTSPVHGGGILNQGGDVELRNTTITLNTADDQTDADNTGDGGGINNDGGTVTVGNSIIADNDDDTPAAGEGEDCYGTLTSLGYNIIGYDGSCSIAPAAGDQIGTAFPSNPIDPMLGPLADNGGPTQTHALLTGSPALDMGSPERSASTVACAGTDQRGVPRPQGGRCDVGAYETGFCADVLINRVGTDGPDVIEGTEGPDGILAKEGNDRVNALGGDDAVCAGGGNDLIRGGGGNDLLLGERGNDRLRGQGGRDVLKGQQGKDKLNGGPGRDRLVGGPKKDTCNGGPGKDRASSCAKERKIP